MSKIKEYFPIPLILFGGIMADISQDILPDIITIQVIAWVSVVVGGIGLARIVWNKVRWFSDSQEAYELATAEPWESRDRKVKNRRNIKNMNKVYPSLKSKKEQKPRVSQNRKLSELDFDEIFKL